MTTIETEVAERIERTGLLDRAVIDCALACSRQYLHASTAGAERTPESIACVAAHPRCIEAELHSDEWTRGYLACVADGFAEHPGVGDGAAVCFVVAQTAAFTSDPEIVRYVARLADGWATNRSKN
jgi:hypothetical protein